VKTNSEVKLLLDLGLQPISNRYLQDPADEEELFPLKLGQCQQTGLIQLIDPVPYEELVPRFDWISYNEPEDHLDELVEKVTTILPNNREIAIGGVSYKDDSTLERFEQLGYETWRISPQRDLGLDKKGGVESVQGKIDIGNVVKIKNGYGKAELLIVRHIWEHVYDQDVFAEALKYLVTENGYLLFEVPDCSNLINNLDYTMIWEEHLYYYTPFTFKQSLRRHGFEICDMEVIPTPYENSLVAFVRMQTSKHVENGTEKSELKEALQRGESYAKEYIPKSKMMLNILSKENRKRKIMLFGAGHISSAFINHFSLKDVIECTIDDNVNKQGLFMPKSGVPIVHSRTLYKSNLTLCLLAINPVHEEKIISKHREFLQQGGEFGSICPLSSYSVYK
jgi:hypothetical protein